jgi:hypothetical protein
MKNKIYYFGIICCLLLLFGCLFKIQHWPGAGIILTLGFALFALVYTPVALINSFRSENNQKLKSLYIIAFICILIICAGALFKIQHWPGAGVFLLFGLPLPFVLFLPVYLRYINRNKQLNYNNTLLVLFFFAYFGAITALLSLNVSKNIIDEAIIAIYGQEQKVNMTNDQTLALMDMLSKSNANDSIKNSVLNIKEKSDNIFKMVDDLKVDIIKSVDGENQQCISNDGEVNLWKINGKDNSLNMNIDVFNGKINELENSLKQYNDLLLSSIKELDTETNTYLKHLLNTEGGRWNDYKNNILKLRLIFIIQMLDQIKKDVGLATLETISVIEERNT